jgi:hypothetical protein
MNAAGLGYKVNNTIYDFVSLNWLYGLCGLSGQSSWLQIQSSIPSANRFSEK